MSDDKHTLTFTNTTRASVPTQSHPVEFYGLPTRCEPPDWFGQDKWNRSMPIPVDRAIVRALVNALAPFANAGSIFALTDNDLGTARAALAAAKEAGL